jgi:hypothetical protein
MSARWRAGLEVPEPYGPGEAEELELAHVGDGAPAQVDDTTVGSD